MPVPFVQKAIFLSMQFLLDAISASVQFAHYKIFEVDTDVYYAHTTTKWKGGNTPPTDFYLTKIKWTWQSDVAVPENILDDITGQLDIYLEARRQEKERELRRKQQ